MLEITDLSGMQWEQAEAAAPRLHDFLFQILEENAFYFLDRPELEGRGFEAWRPLVAQYAPTGGAYELDSMMAFMIVHQCKSLSELSGAVSKFERDVGQDEHRTGKLFPKGWKIQAFLRMVPKLHASDMQAFLKGYTGL